MPVGQSRPVQTSTLGVLSQSIKDGRVVTLSRVWVKEERQVRTVTMDCHFR
jgi:hypothetical protein